MSQFSPASHFLGILPARWASTRFPGKPLVPILGILANFGLMLGLGIENWLRLVIWMAIGLAIYFGYSRHHSKVRELSR